MKNKHGFIRNKIIIHLGTYIQVIYYTNMSKIYNKGHNRLVNVNRNLISLQIQ